MQVKQFLTIIWVLLFLSYASQVLAIDFEFEDIKGKKYQLSDYKGKWVVLNYWATWCPPCRKEIPMLADYDDEHDNVQIFGINQEPGIEKDKLNDFIDTYLVSYPTIPVTKAIAKKFGYARGLPMTVFISPEGIIIKKYTGMLNKSFLDRILK